MCVTSDHPSSMLMPHLAGVHGPILLPFPLGSVEDVGDPELAEVVAVAGGQPAHQPGYCTDNDYDVRDVSGLMFPAEVCDKLPCLQLVAGRAGNEPSRSFKLQNHGGGPHQLTFKML